MHLICLSDFQSWIADKFKSFIRLYKDFDKIVENLTPLLVFLCDDALHILQKNNLYGGFSA